jgi:hypothetical protein
MERKLLGIINVVLGVIMMMQEEWRKLHNEELNDPYTSHNIVRLIKSKRLRWAGHLARIRLGRAVYRVLVVKPD